MGMMRGEFEVVDAAPAPSLSPTSPRAEPPLTAEPIAPEPLAAPKTYTVQRGDSLRAIAKKLYGREGRWRDIVAANPALNLKKPRPGQILNLPTGVKP